MPAAKRWPWLAAAATAPVRARPSLGETSPADGGVPSGTVAFLRPAATVPKGGWSPAPPPARAGRHAGNGNVVGQRVGEPLADQEDRVLTTPSRHRHPVPTAQRGGAQQWGQQAGRAGRGPHRRRQHGVVLERGYPVRATDVSAGKP